MSALELLVARLDIPVAEEGAFVYCGECNEAHRVTRLDRVPVFGTDGSVLLQDDFRAFLLRHAEHPLRVLHRASDAEMHSHARHDPMCRMLWEVADAEDRRFVVAFGREDVESPRRYTVQPGRLVVVHESIGLDEELLRAVVDEALYPHLAPVSRLDWLVQACRNRMVGLSWDAFDPIDEQRGAPNTHLACLPASVLAAVAREATGIFGGPEGERIQDLLRHEFRFEIPVVRLRRRYAVEAT